MIKKYRVPGKELTWEQLTAPIEDKPFTRDMIADWLNGAEFTGVVDVRMGELQEAVSKFSIVELVAMDDLENNLASELVKLNSMEWIDDDKNEYDMIIRVKKANTKCAE